MLGPLSNFRQSSQTVAGLSSSPGAGKSHELTISQPVSAIADPRHNHWSFQPPQRLELPAARDNTMTCDFKKAHLAESRRTFFAKSGIGLGSLAMATLWNSPTVAIPKQTPATLESLRLRQGYFAAKAKNVIYLFTTGRPSHLDLFDYKSQLERCAGQPMPDLYIGKIRFKQIQNSQPPLMPSP